VKEKGRSDRGREEREKEGRGKTNPMNLIDSLGKYLETSEMTGMRRGWNFFYGSRMRIESAKARRSKDASNEKKKRTNHSRIIRVNSLDLPTRNDSVRPDCSFQRRWNGSNRLLALLELLAKSSLLRCRSFGGSLRLDVVGLQRTSKTTEDVRETK